MYFFHRCLIVICRINNIRRNTIKHLKIDFFLPLFIIGIIFRDIRNIIGIGLSEVCDGLRFRKIEDCGKKWSIRNKLDPFCKRSMIDWELLRNAYDFIFGDVGSRFECGDGYQVSIDEKRSLQDKRLCPSAIRRNDIDQRDENIVYNLPKALISRVIGCHHFHIGENPRNIVLWRALQSDLN